MSNLKGKQSEKTLTILEICQRVRIKEQQIDEAVRALLQKRGKK